MSAAYVVERVQMGVIPALVALPVQTCRRHLVIWLPGFTGAKETVSSQLEDLAQRGFIAVAFDPREHGERGNESEGALVQRVHSNIRRHFWPILAGTADDVSLAIDWASSYWDIEPEIYVGGVSMGGDIAVAAAGLDRRITRVAACISTPDWLRPGSSERQGEADAAAQADYERCNPATNLASYRHKPAISFQCGARDSVVPPESPMRFADALARWYEGVAARLNVTLHADVGHSFTEPMWQGALDWFTRPGRSF